MATGLEMKAGDMQAYQLSLLWNNGLVNNQSLHCNCTTLDKWSESGDSGDQDMQEEDSDLDNGEWCKLPLS